MPKVREQAELAALAYTELLDLKSARALKIAIRAGNLGELAHCRILDGEWIGEVWPTAVKTLAKINMVDKLGKSARKPNLAVTHFPAGIGRLATAVIGMVMREHPVIDLAPVGIDLAYVIGDKPTRPAPSERIDGVAALPVAADIIIADIH